MTSSSIVDESVEDLAKASLVPGRTPTTSIPRCSDTVIDPSILLDEEPPLATRILGLSATSTESIDDALTISRTDMGSELGSTQQTRPAYRGPPGSSSCARLRATMHSKGACSPNSSPHTPERSGIDLQAPHELAVAAPPSPHAERSIRGENTEFRAQMPTLRSPRHIRREKPSKRPRIFHAFQLHKRLMRTCIICIQGHA